MFVEWWVDFAEFFINKFLINLTEIVMKKINTIYHYIKPLCLSKGIIGFLLYFEVNYLEIEMIG